MAAGLTSKLLQDLGVRDIEVRSAGVMTVNGLLATTETLQMLKSVNVTLERHRSTPVSVDLLRKCDLILGMTPLHVQHALRMAPEIRGRVFLLKEFTRSDLKKVQIDDPMGNTLEVYKKVFSEIKSACVKFTKTTYISGKDDKDGHVKDDKKGRKRVAAKVTPKKAKPAPAAASTKAVKSAPVSSKAAKSPAVPAPPKARSKTVVAPKASKMIGRSK